MKNIAFEVISIDDKPPIGKYTTKFYFREKAIRSSLHWPEGRVELQINYRGIHFSLPATVNISITGIELITKKEFSATLKFYFLKWKGNIIGRFDSVDINQEITDIMSGVIDLTNIIKESLYKDSNTKQREEQ